MKQKFLPESLYNVDSSMTREKLSVFYENNSSVTGKVIRLNLENHFLEVDLGGGFIASMPLGESTIYQIYRKDGSLSPNIYELVGKTIQAKILCFIFDDIILSRKENMLEALKSLKNETYIEFASIIGFSKISAFLDVGAGIIGRSYGKNFCNTLYHDIKDLGIKKGSIISVKVLSFLENENHFELSRVDALPSIYEILSENDVVTCKVFGPVGDEEGIGYFVGIYNNYFCGIVDSRYVSLEYGDEIVARIRKITPKGPKLTFLAKVL